MADRPPEEALLPPVFISYRSETGRWAGMLRLSGDPAQDVAHEFPPGLWEVTLPSGYTAQFQLRYGLTFEAFRDHVLFVIRPGGRLLSWMNAEYWVTSLPGGRTSEPSAFRIWSSDKFHSHFYSHEQGPTGAAASAPVVGSRIVTETGSIGGKWFARGASYAQSRMVEANNGDNSSLDAIQILPSGLGSDWIQFKSRTRNIQFQGITGGRSYFTVLPEDCLFDGETFGGVIFFHGTSRENVGARPSMRLVCPGTLDAQIYFVTDHNSMTLCSRSAARHLLSKLEHGNLRPSDAIACAHHLFKEDYRGHEKEFGALLTRLVRELRQFESTGSVDAHIWIKLIEYKYLDWFETNKTNPLRWIADNMLFQVPRLPAFSCSLICWSREVETAFSLWEDGDAVSRMVLDWINKRRSWINALQWSGDFLQYQATTPNVPARGEGESEPLAPEFYDD